MHIYIYMRRTYTLDSILNICIAVRSCLLLPSDDIYSTSNPNFKFPIMYLICMYIYFSGSAPVEVVSVIYRGKLNQRMT